MFKNISKLTIILLCVIAIASTHVMAQESAETKPAESKPIGVTFGLNYMSNYIWRGLDWYKGDGVFLPTVSYAVLDTGLSLTVGAEISDNWLFEKEQTNSYKNKNSHATDFAADYSYTIEKLLTVGAGAWYILMWNYDKKGTYTFATGYVYVSLDTVPFTPTLTYNHDYLVDNGDYKDFYINFALSHSFTPVKDTSLDLGFSTGWYQANSVELSGISDINFSIGASITAGAVKYSSKFNYTIVPSKDFYNNYQYTEKDINRFYASFGATYTL